MVICGVFVFVCVLIREHVCALLFNLKKFSNGCANSKNVITSSLVDDSTNVTIEKVIRAKRTGEFVHRTFNDLENKYTLVSDGKNQILLIIVNND